MGQALYRNVATSSPMETGEAAFRGAGTDQGVGVLLVVWVVSHLIHPNRGRKQRHQLRENDMGMLEIRREGKWGSNHPETGRVTAPRILARLPGNFGDPLGIIAVVYKVSHTFPHF